MQRVILHTPGGNWWGSNGGEEAMGPYPSRKGLIDALDGKQVDDDRETAEDPDAVLSMLEGQEAPT